MTIMTSRHLIFIACAQKIYIDKLLSRVPIQPEHIEQEFSEFDDVIDNSDDSDCEDVDDTDEKETKQYNTMSL